MGRPRACASQSAPRGSSSRRTAASGPSQEGKEKLGPILRSQHPWIAARSADERADAIKAIITRSLTDNAAFISTSQAVQSVVNAPFATDDVTKPAYRPSGDGRVLLIPVGGDPAGAARSDGSLDI